jgi:hypothetical protein
MSIGFGRSEVSMLYNWSEPSLAETLSDPMVRALMAADAVDPDALDTLLREVAHRSGIAPLVLHASRVERILERCIDG